MGWRDAAVAGRRHPLDARNRRPPDHRGGAAAGLLFSLVHAVATITFRVDHIVSGVVINVVAIGLARFLSQLFFDQAEEPGTYSRHQTGLHHLAFLVASRAVVRAAHQWAREREAIILDEPGEFPQYGEHCFAPYGLDPHGFKLEAVCHTPEES